LRGLDARTTTVSFVAGAQAQVQAGGFRLGAMAAYDRADAHTRRLAPGGATVDGRFALKNWIANLDVSYHARLSADWAVEPRLSATSVRTTRDGVTETGGGVFALSVAAGHSTQSFVDGRIAFEGGQQTGHALHPFAAIGFVSRTGGGAGTASASLAGLGVPLTADGLDRDGTRAAVEAGVRYDLSGTLKASAGYSGEFGTNGRQALSVGLHWAF
jgi:outer membrane autotransporter protein